MTITNGRPSDHASVTPHLIVDNAAEAIDFYRRAFGAEEIGRLACPQTGKVMHADVRVGDSRLWLADADDRFGTRSPRQIGGTATSLHLFVPDVDKAIENAVAEGATLLMPASDQFWGARFGQVEDPYGHRWSLATQTAEPTIEQMQASMAQMGA
ncbi:MAG: VOC family protein [Myxococcales bacterium]|nr:VOC family protein [Myxococcales bacterium]